MNTPTLTELAILFILLFAVFRALEMSLPRERRTPFLRRGLLTDLSYWLFNPFVAEIAINFVMLAVLATFAFVTYGRVDKPEILAGFGPLSRLPVPIQTVLMLILADFIGYWMHRLFHGRRLWCFHAIHHSSKTLDWISAARAHPLNELAGRTASMLPLLALGFQVEAAAVIAPLITLYALFLHANVDWDWGRLRTVIASPRFHRWHHTSEAEGRDKNFATLFPVWDILFGTYYMPKARIPERFGTDTPVPEGLFAQLAFPFRRTQGFKFPNGPAADELKGR